jgi:protease I
MNKPLSGIKIATLVSNGFCEKDFTETQRSLTAEGALVKVVSLDQGLVNSWQGNGWGHHFAVDISLSSALAADYSMLVIPGGRRSIDKLKLTAHTRRFIGGFMAAAKPVAVCGSALELMIFADQVGGRTVTGPDSLKDDAVKAGAEWSGNTYVKHKNLLTGQAGSNLGDFTKAMMEGFIEFAQNMPKAA